MSVIQICFALACVLAILFSIVAKYQTAEVHRLRVENRETWLALRASERQLSVYQDVRGIGFHPVGMYQSGTVGALAYAISTFAHEYVPAGISLEIAERTNLPDVEVGTVRVVIESGNGKAKR